MATQALHKRINWIIAISVFSIIFLSTWLFHNPVDKLIRIPTMSGPKPQVTIRQGTIIGFEAEQGYPQALETFLGIPYGLSTGGERRFCPPVPVAPGVEVFDAGRYGQRCPSGARDATPEGEDCLNLNIYRPKVRDESKKAPVLVYVHGGGFNFGAGNTRQISHLTAWSAQPMIGISFNYRVGAFGFLPSKFMEDEGLLNLGLKDQALLFQWVQENIAAFGGDPENVTIMGSSAGAHSVYIYPFAFHGQKLIEQQIGHHLLHSTDRPPPFQRAILESGAATARAVYTPSNPLHEAQFQEFLHFLRIPSLPTSQILPALRNRSSSEIKYASGAIFEKYDPSVRWPFQPVIDGPGGMIPIAPITAWKSGAFHRIPILTGFNANEGSMFVPQNASTSQDFTDFFSTLLPSLSKYDLDLLNELYPDPVSNKGSKYKETRKGLGAQFTRLEQAYGHFAYVAPVLQTALFASSPPPSASNTTSNSSPISEMKIDGPLVYLYEFALPTNPNLLTFHGSHAPFITHSPETQRLSTTVKQISGAMHAYWTSFILTGDPNAIRGEEGSRVVWPRFGGEEKENMVVFGEGNNELIGGRGKGVVVKVKGDGDVRKDCGFWMERTELFEI